MSTLTLPKSSPSQTSPQWTPRPMRWTCDEFHRVGEAGTFEGRRAMLIDGIILEQGPMNPPHAITLEIITDRLRMVFGTGWRVRIQTPLVLSLDTDPEPDLAILPGHPRDILAHPTTASLVIEVSDSTLSFDRGEKANLYAAGGIADYWVIDLVHRQLLVFRDPQPGQNHPHGHVYREQSTFGPTEAVAPLAALNSSIVVADLLP